MSALNYFKIIEVQFNILEACPPLNPRGRGQAFKGRFLKKNKKASKDW
jgi:hypothetical protein